MILWRYATTNSYDSVVGDRTPESRSLAARRKNRKTDSVPYSDHRVGSRRAGFPADRVALGPGPSHGFEVETTFRPAASGRVARFPAVGTAAAVHACDRAAHFG